MPEDVVNPPSTPSGSRTADCDGLAPVDWLGAHPLEKLARAKARLDAAAHGIAFTAPDSLDHNFSVAGTLVLQSTDAAGEPEAYHFPACGYILHGFGVDEFRRGVSSTYAGRPVCAGLFIRDDAEAFPQLATIADRIGLDGANDRHRALVWDHITTRFERGAVAWYCGFRMRNVVMRPGHDTRSGLDPFAWCA